MLTFPLWTTSTLWSFSRGSRPYPRALRALPAVMLSNMENDPNTQCDLHGVQVNHVYTLANTARMRVLIFESGTFANNSNKRGSGMWGFRGCARGWHPDHSKVHFVEKSSPGS